MCLTSKWNQPQTQSRWKMFVSCAFRMSKMSPSLYFELQTWNFCLIDDCLKFVWLNTELIVNQKNTDSSSPLFPQTATDSSSNSSQKREPTLHSLAPPHFCEARRHHCILGHFYEHHRPSDHYFLEQVSQGKSGTRDLFTNRKLSLMHPP